MSHPAGKALSGTAFATLLLIALMMGANHVAARIAFNNGVDVATAVVFRSTVTALVLVVLLGVQGARVRLTRRHGQMLPVIGLLVGVQSLCLYSAVARLPVALALLAFNTYPIWTAFWARVIYRHPPERAMLIAMPVILLGLSLALDVLGAASGLGAAGQWARIGAGVAFALAAAATFGLALVITQHEAADVDGRVRTATTMMIAGAVALATVAVQGGFHLPTAPPGWWGLACTLEAVEIPGGLQLGRQERTDPVGGDSENERPARRNAGVPRPDARDHSVLTLHVLDVGAAPDVSPVLPDHSHRIVDVELGKTHPGDRQGGALPVLQKRFPERADEHEGRCRTAVLVHDRDGKRFPDRTPRLRRLAHAAEPFVNSEGGD